MQLCAIKEKLTNNDRAWSSEVKCVGAVYEIMCADKQTVLDKQLIKSQPVGLKRRALMRDTRGLRVPQLVFQVFGITLPFFLPLAVWSLLAPAVHLYLTLLF